MGEARLALLCELLWAYLRIELLLEQVRRPVAFRCGWHERGVLAEPPAVGMSAVEAEPDGFATSATAPFDPKHAFSLG